MADILMKRKHGLEAQEVHARIEKLAGKLSDRLGGSWCWEGQEAICQARGAQARVGYDETSISMQVKLPLMLRPMRARLEAKIEQYFDEYFREDARS
jgi:putative polyhydroxyalkanoate system protein